MKTLLFSPMWLDKEDRLERNVKWIKYTTPLKSLIEYDNILLVDNASSFENLNVIRSLSDDIIVHRCDKHLPRTKHLEYEYWYRAFRIALDFASSNNYDKLVHIDSDMFVLNKRICDYLKNSKSGWIGFWCKKYNFPETSLQIINKDQFDKASKFFAKDYLPDYGIKPAELIVPFTHVEKSFTGDRYGETKLPQTFDMDYYAQTPNDVILRFT